MDQHFARVRAGSGLAVLVLCALVFVSPAAAERYVALGDSYSAGNGASAYDFDNDADCLRSTKAYAPLIKNDLGAGSSFRFVACSGAKTNHITTNTQNANPIQSNVLGSDTLDVTISIGGNDAGFTDVLTRCALPLVSCDGDIDSAQAKITNDMPGWLDATYSRIRQKAPNARVGVVGYPRLFPANGDDCSAATFFSAGEITRLNQTADLLAEVVRDRARAHGFTFIDSRPAFLGHAWCEDEWINGLSNPTNKSYHPNDRGYVGYAGITRAALLAAPEPSFSRGPNGRIAFSSSRDGNAEIYVINGDGAFPINLTQSASIDRDPVFSPDGTRIAFASDRDGDFEIYTMSAAGGPLTKLTSNSSDDLEPAWSPNGARIVFRSDRDGNNEIYKMNADGSSQVRLTSNTASDFAPSFSPDGAEIAFQRFTSGTAVGQGNEIFKMNADGQGQINLTANAAAVNDGSPEWSPDGSRIAFQSNRNGDFDIYTMTATGSSVTRLTTHVAADRNPVWSPSGSHLAFESERDGSSQIYTMTANGSGQARRTSGNATELTPSWQGDSRPPVTTIDSAPASSTNNPIGTFEFSSDEPGSTFECRVDSSPFQACSSPLVTEPLTDGPHGFAVRAKDPSGNVDPNPAFASFTIDTSGKVTEITAAPSGPVKVNQPVFEFLSEDATVTFECRLNPGGDPEAGWSPCTSPHSTGQLSDGEYRFEVRGTDGIGNVESPPQYRTFVVDTTAPQSTVTFGPAAVGVDRNPSFQFTADQAGSTFECRLTTETEGTWNACESPFRPGTLSDGNYRFEVRATDPAGNEEAVGASFDFRIDTVTPVTTIESGPGQAEPSPNVTFEFSADEGSVRFECRLDSFDDAAWTACVSPRTYTGLHYGRHSFQVRAIDQAGNVELPPATSEFGVKTDPGLAITGAPSSLSSDTTPAFTFTADDPDMEFECRFSTGGVGEWEVCSSPFRPGGANGLNEGEYRFELRGTDWFESVKPAGEPRQKTTLPPFDWTVVTGPPRPSIVAGPGSLDNSRSPEFTIDPGWGADTVQCQIDGLAWSPCDPDAALGDLVSVRYSGLHDGLHRLRVRSSNPLFGLGPEVTFEWTIDATPPEVRIDRGPSGRTAQATNQIAFTGTGGASGFRCRVDGQPPAGTIPTGADGYGTCASPISLSGLPDGDHLFEVVALDPAGTVSSPATRRWAQDTEGPSVRLIAQPQTETLSRDATFGFEAPESSVSFRCRLDGGDWRPCISPATFVQLQPGSHTFGVSAIDSLGNQGPITTYEWRVSEPARPTIGLKRKVRIGKSGGAAVATVGCPLPASCTVKGPSTVRILQGKRKIPGRLMLPRQISPGSQAKVRIQLNRKARKALGRRTGKLKLSLRVTSDSGTTRAASGTVQISR